MSNIDFSALITAEDKLAAARSAALDRLAQIRWTHETIGIVLEDGRHVDTSRDSQAQIANAAAGVRAGLITAPLPWKTLQGWTELPPEAVLNMAAQVNAHVQACFAAERAVDQMIQQATPLGNLDLEGEFSAALAAV